MIPGGWAPDKMRRDPAILDLVRGVHARGLPIGIICHGGSVAISAGIVGARATGSLGIKDDLVNAGAEWVDEPAFRDGNLVWGRVVADIPDFARELVAALTEPPGPRPLAGAPVGGRVERGRPPSPSGRRPRSRGRRRCAGSARGAAAALGRRQRAAGRAATRAR